MAFQPVLAADTQIIEKTQHFATSLTFRARGSSFYFFLAELHLLSSDSTSLLCFASSDSASLLCFFQLSILSDVRLLNFL